MVVIFIKVQKSSISRGVLVLRRVEIFAQLEKKTPFATSEQQQPQLQPSKGASSPLQCQGVTS